MFLQERALHFLYDDYNSPSDKIFMKSGEVSMEFNRLRYLRIEIYKSINNNNPIFMKQIFQLRETNKIVRKQFNKFISVFSESIMLAVVKKVWDITCLKSGTPFHFRLSLVKILKLSKKLLKIGKMPHVTVGSVRVFLY